MSSKEKMLIGSQAIDDARNNAKINGFDNAEFFVGKAEEVLPEQYEVNHVYADVIVVDPPRKGSDKPFLDALKKLSPRKVVYISCNPHTQVEDLKHLLNQYKITKIQPVDMFPQTAHVESCVLLCRE